MELRSGKEINDIWLARQLRPLGIKPTTLWINDVPAKGYRLDGFQGIFKRYISRSDYETLLAESGYLGLS